VNYRDLLLSCHVPHQTDCDELCVYRWLACSFMRGCASRKELLTDNPGRRSRAPSCTGLGRVYTYDPSLDASCSPPDLTKRHGPEQAIGVAELISLY
jgi:hypothetical protein